MSNIICIKSKAYIQIEEVSMAELVQQPVQSVGHKAVKVKRERKYGLAWYSKLGLWKSKNCKFDPAAMQAYSYDWWLMLDRIDGMLVFNKYRYSVSTARHQWSIRQFLYDHGVAYVSIEAPNGLNNLSIAVGHYNSKINALQKEIDNPRSRPHKNLEREKEIAVLECERAMIKRFIKAKAKQGVA